MDQCYEHSGCVQKINTLEREMADVHTKQSDHERRILDIETEGKVAKAALSRADRVLVIIIPAMVTLAGIIWQHYATASTVANAAMGGR